MKVIINNVIFISEIVALDFSEKISSNILLLLVIYTTLTSKSKGKVCSYRQVCNIKK